MNLFLGFKNSEQSKDYHSWYWNRKSHSWNQNSKLLLIYLVLSPLLNIAIYAQADDASEVMEAQKSETAFGFGLAVLVIAFRFLWKHQPLSQVFTDAIIIIISVANIIVPFELFLPHTDNLASQDFWINYWTFICYRVLPTIFFTFSYYSWIRKVMMLVFTISYSLLRMTPSVLLGGQVAFVVCVNMVCAYSLYEIEKNRKAKFLQETATKSEQKLQSNLLNNLPEGIIVFDACMKPLYINKTMNTVLGTDDNEKAILQKLSDLNLEHIVNEVQKHNESPAAGSQLNSPSRMLFPSPEISPLKEQRKNSDAIRIFLDKSSPTVDKLIKPRPSKIDLSVPSIYLDDLTP